MLINAIIISKALEHMFYSKKMAKEVLFGARKFSSVLFGGLSPFLSLVGPVTDGIAKKGYQLDFAKST